MNIKTIIIFIAVTLGVLGGVGGLLYQFGAAGEKPIPEVAGNKVHMKGTGSITLVEFSDFQCPACLAVQEPLKQILSKYEGKLEFVYRYFPLTTIHKNAMISAQAAEAAGMQGKFFEMHDKLFATQSVWAPVADPSEMFVGYAKEMGIDADKFKTDMEGQTVKDTISLDLLDTTRYRLTGTPTFFVNGAKVEFGEIESKLSELTK